MGKNEDVLLEDVHHFMWLSTGALYGLFPSVFEYLADILKSMNQ